jgi:hypothetical protein
MPALLVLTEGVTDPDAYVGNRRGDEDCGDVGGDARR